MNVLFNISEAFVIAVQIEKNGAAFYKEAASSVSDSAVQELFNELAAQELEHEKVFAELAESSDGNVVLDELSESYVKAVAGEYVFSNEEAQKKDFSSLTFLEAVNFAIEREKDSIVFFIGILDSVEGDDYDKIKSIIQEEKGHLVDLLRLKNQAR